MSIGRKFTLWLVSILLLAMVATVLTFSSFELNEEKKKIEILSRMTGEFIQESLVSAMLEQEVGRLHQKLTDIKKNADVVGNIWILNRDGIVRDSTDHASIGKKLSSLPTGGSLSGKGVLLEKNKTYRLARTVPNDPPCRRCHGKRAEYNGAVVIDFSANKILDHLPHEIYAVGAIMLVALVLTGAAVLFAWNMLVRKRLNAVIDKVKSLQEGAGHSEGETAGTDEVARLERDFNEMAEAVRARNIEKENLVQQLSRTNADLVQEIASRTQWESMLREQKIFSDNLTQNSAVATFVLDKDHRVVIWNKACERLTGVRAADMVGTDNAWKPFYRRRRETLADLVIDGKSDLSGLYEKHARSTLIGNGLHAEGWYQNLNGSDRYIIFDAAPILDSSGELTAAIETLQDVTEQKNLEEAFARSEAQLRTIIDTEPECVKLISPEGEILEINRSGVGMVEAETPDQVVGRSVMSFIEPEHHTAVLGHLARVLQGKRDTIEFEMIGLKGVRRWMETCAAPLRNGRGEIFAVLALTRDVTERKQWEKRLQEQLQFLQTLMETIPMPVFYKDVQGVYQGCNKAFASYMGKPKTAIIGKNVYAIAPKDLADEYVRRDQELFQNPGVQVYEYSLSHSDGTYRDVIANKASFTDSSGKPAGLVGVIQDITTRKKAEAALRESEARFRELAALLPQPVYEADMQGLITFGNKSAYRYFGYRSEELGSLKIADVLVPEDRDRARKNLEALLRGEQPAGHEYMAVAKDGKRFPVIVYSAPVVRSGQIVGFRGIIMDITARKEAEEAIRQTNETLKTLVNASPIPIMVLDPSGNVIVWNPAAERVFGWAAGEVIGRFNPIVPPEKRDEFIQFQKRVLSGEAFTAIELKRKKKDESDIEVSLSTAPLRDAQGHIVGVMALLTDITERKRAEEAIRRHYDTQTAINWILHISLVNMPLENILKQALDLILSIPWLSFQGRGSIFLVENDPDKLVLKAQRGLSEQIRQECAVVSFGKCHCGTAASRGEVQFASALDPDHVISYDGIVQHGHYCVPIMSARTVVGVINIYLREGHAKDDKEIEFLNSIANALAGIVKRNRAEAALQESEKRYRTMAEEREKLIDELRKALNTISVSHKEWQETFDNITDMIAIIDKNFNILKANKAFAAYLGLHPREVVNKKCHQLRSETDSPIPGCPGETTSNEKNACSEEIVDKRTNKVFRTTTFPYFSADGEISGWINVSHDITEEKEREMRLIMSERLAALGQMASGIAHEINNPLASIAGCSEGLLTRVRKGKYEQKLFETYLNIIQEEIFRCKNITTAMLSFVRKTTYEKKQVNINDAMDKAIEIISFQGRLKNVRVEKKYESCTPIYANEGELRQVFLSVITNALDAMKDSGTLTLGTGANGNSVFARITDSGPGIAPENITRIFDPFYTTKSETGGTGLGLSIAQKIIHNQNGAIEVASEAGKGCVFTITLPVS